MQPPQLPYYRAESGQDAPAKPGDFILCHRRGFASACIRAGETIRYKGGSHWSHAAFCISESEIVEALTHGVMKHPLSVYRHIEYVLVQTEMDPLDVKQSVAFAESCVGQRYGFAVDAAIALRFLTPGRGLWFGLNGTEICSGLVAQALCRGWFNFDVNPSSLSPAELAMSCGVPASVAQLDRARRS